MLENHDETVSVEKVTVDVPHPVFPQLSTCSCLSEWDKNVTIELPRLRITIHSVDYLTFSSTGSKNELNEILRFQQDSYRLWYQIDGYGILQNVTRKSFGSARPGLLGVMERGERHTYMHQKGSFACFIIQFSFLPSNMAKCYWNAGIEGKTVLAKEEQRIIERYIFDFITILSEKREMLGIASLSKLLDIFALLFNKNLILIEESRFPRNKAKSLVVKAKNFMDINYSNLQHQKRLEDECGVDINYLNILFKKETGRTLYQYMVHVRMEHAKHYLETTDTSINDIATATGYPNANSFSRAFKRCVKVTPVEYRRKPSHKL